MTMHELYLQLRLDTLASTLKLNRDKTFELGALALQAEYSDRLNNNVQYFQNDNYLPKVNKLKVWTFFRGSMQVMIVHERKISYPNYTRIIVGWELSTQKRPLYK